MEEHELERVVEDVQFIRKVMDRTSELAIGLNNVFIWWGLALTLIGAISNILLLILPDFTNNILNDPILIIIPKAFVALACTVIFFVMKKDVSSLGFNNQLLILWLAIFGYNIILPVFRLFITYSILHQPLVFNPSIIYIQFIPEYSWVSFAVGMLCMRLFARLKAASWFVVFYAALWLLVNLSMNSFSVIFSSYVLPLSLLMLGIFLKLKYRNISKISLEVEV